MNVDETILIAKKWEAGERGDTDRYAKDNDFIEKGFTKQGVYARFKDKEYVLTQLIDEMMSKEDVKEVLKTKFELLCQCAGFKQHFDNYARTRGVHTIPSFYFNFVGAIVGKLKPSLSSRSSVLPHHHFLSTPLLPCSKVDGQIQKFTGNDDIGNATDSMTMAIHAFSHFLLRYSLENLLFCDLQGMPDSKGVMCLIDPQAHTSQL
ncbi:hypothetical protein C0995_009825 [Termitomyces sp. Mi166|nr:hypothetical protein C0995_009825 [Termitomyces sp. Mi166\